MSALHHDESNRGFELRDIFCCSLCLVLEQKRELDSTVNVILHLIVNITSPYLIADLRQLDTPIHAPHVLGTVVVVVHLLGRQKRDELWTVPTASGHGRFQPPRATDGSNCLGPLLPVEICLHSSTTDWHKRHIQNMEKTQF